MTDQLELGLPATLRSLKPRQRAAYNALQDSGADGLEDIDIGALLHSLKEGRWAHSSADICKYCKRDGLQVLKRLRDLGLVRYRSKRKVWTVIDAPEPEAESREFPNYNTFPEGF